MVNCEECDKEISSKAESCPHCGCPTHNKSKGIFDKGKDFFEKSKDKLEKLLEDEPQDEVNESKKKKDDSKGIFDKGKDFFKKSKDKLEKFLEDEPQDEVNEPNKKKDDEKPKKIQDETVDEVKSQGDSDEKSEETSGKQPDSESEVEDGSDEDKPEKEKGEAREENASATVQEKDSDEETNDSEDNAVVQSMSGEENDPGVSSHPTKKEKKKKKKKKKKERTNEGSTQECPSCKSVINRSAAVCPECNANTCLVRFSLSKTSLIFGLLGGLIFLTLSTLTGWPQEFGDTCWWFWPLLLPFFGFKIGWAIAFRYQTKKFFAGQSKKSIEESLPLPIIKKAFIGTIIAFFVLTFSFAYWPKSESGQEEENIIDVKTNGSKAYYEISVTHGGYDSVFQTSIMEHIHAVSTSVDDDVLTLDLTVNWINAKPTILNEIYMTEGGKFIIEGIRLSTPRKFSKDDYASPESMADANDQPYEFGWLGIKFKLHLEKVLTELMPFEEQRALGGWQ